MSARCSLMSLLDSLMSFLVDRWIEQYAFDPYLARCGQNLVRADDISSLSVRDRFQNRSRPRLILLINYIETAHTTVRNKESSVAFWGERTTR